MRAILAFLWLLVVSVDAAKKKATKAAKGDAVDAKALKLGDSGDLNEALAKFKKAVKIEPKNGRILENMAVAQMRLQKFEDAERAFGHAAELGHKVSKDNLKALAQVKKLKGKKAATEAAKAGYFIRPERTSPAAPAKGKGKKTAKVGKKKAAEVGADGSTWYVPDAVDDTVAPNETVLWRQGDEEAPSVPGISIFLPEAVGRISKFTVDHGDNDTCGYKDFTVLRDTRGEIIITAVDDFFSDKIIAKIMDIAVNTTKHKLEWSWADIHPNMQKHLAHDKRKGISFPGLRLHVSSLATHLVVKCLTPVMKIVNPNFNLKKTKESQTLFGLFVPHEGIKDPEGRPIHWLDSQRIPHTDIRWDHGTLPGGKVPYSYASVLPLTRDFNLSGTGLWRERVTKLNVLRTVSENEEAQGNMNPHVENRKHKELDLLEEIPDPAPHALIEHAWAECILVPRLRFNRFAFYDGRHLHQQFLEPQDYPRLNKDPRIGRLTINSFFWGKGNK